MPGEKAKRRFSTTLRRLRSSKSDQKHHSHNESERFLKFAFNLKSQNKIDSEAYDVLVKSVRTKQLEQDSEDGSSTSGKESQSRQRVDSAELLLAGVGGHLVDQHESHAVREARARNRLPPSDPRHYTAKELMEIVESDAKWATVNRDVRRWSTDSSQQNQQNRLHIGMLGESSREELLYGNPRRDPDQISNSSAKSGGGRTGGHGGSHHRRHSTAQDSSPWEESSNAYGPVNETLRSGKSNSRADTVEIKPSATGALSHSRKRSGAISQPRKLSVEVVEIEPASAAFRIQRQIALCNKQLEAGKQQDAVHEKQRSAVLKSLEEESAALNLTCEALEKRLLERQAASAAARKARLRSMEHHLTAEMDDCQSERDRVLTILAASSQRIDSNLRDRLGVNIDKEVGIITTAAINALSGVVKEVAELEKTERASLSDRAIRYVKASVCEYKNLPTPHYWLFSHLVLSLRFGAQACTACRRCQRRGDCSAFKELNERAFEQYGQDKVKANIFNNQCNASLFFGNAFNSHDEQRTGLPLPGYVESSSSQSNESSDRASESLKIAQQPHMIDGHNCADRSDAVMTAARRRLGRRRRKEKNTMAKCATFVLRFLACILIVFGGLLIFGDAILS